jgi:uncharacterized protein YcaQ
VPTPALPAASTLAVTSVAARRFARAATGLDSPHATIADALAHHGYIQIDPINICGRMHDLILRNRVSDYQEGALMRVLHGNAGDAPLPPAQRVAFEHHLPTTSILVALTLDAWPHLQGTMQRRAQRPGPWSGRLTPREKILAEHLLAEIRARGPLGSEDFEDNRRARQVWGAANLVKATLQKLFFHGRVLIAQRVNHRRRYDLPERVLPASILAAPIPTPARTDRWLALLKLRQRRLTPLKREELRHVAADVQRVVLTDLPAETRCPPLYCLRQDTPLLETLSMAAAPADSSARPALTKGKAELPRLLAPLDPLIYDRRVTSALWNFEYTWEVYTPPAQRVRGYYALPILKGTQLIGHVDPKADRLDRRLRVVSRRIRRGHALAPALAEFARWLGLRA